VRSVPDDGAGESGPDPARRPRPRRGPLAGVRVADFGWMGVGSCATRLLADYGAEVIKIEDRTRLDNIRRLPFYPGGEYSYGKTPANPDPDLGGLHNNYSRNKLGVTINMRTERGRDLARRLIASSSVVTENFAPGVMERWGLTYETLRELVPDVIYARMSGFGHSGPNRDYRSYGPVVQAVSGLSYAGGLPGREPSGYGFSYMDNMAASFASAALLMAIRRRRRTGLGTEIDIAAVEVGVNLLGPTLLDAAVNGTTYPRDDFPSGNRAIGTIAAPHGVYPCARAAGRDRWIAIAVLDDAQWLALGEVLGSPAWALDPAYRRAADRLAQADDLDKYVGASTATWDGPALMTALQARGVPAGIVQQPNEIVDSDPQLAQRPGTFFRLDHPRIGAATFEGSPTVFGDIAPDHWRSAPMIGEDNQYVFGELLGLDADELAGLADEGVI
jgi:crotonobetainyl-CoA:carnitine CoA-transferase CaiB-like acyl-CoA transferase